MKIYPLGALIRRLRFTARLGAYTDPTDCFPDPKYLAWAIRRYAPRLTCTEGQCADRLDVIPACPA